MNEQTEQRNNDMVKKTTLVMAVFLSIIMTILVLEMNGFIQHNQKKDDTPVAEYTAVFIEKQENKQYRLSHKPSKQTAVCNAGYLFITSDDDFEMQGLLVDFKNRGVKCLPNVKPQ